MMAAFAEEDAYDSFCARIDPDERPSYDAWLADFKAARFQTIRSFFTTTLVAPLTFSSSA